MSESPAKVVLLTDEQLHDLLVDAATRAVRAALLDARSERGLRVADVAARLACAESTVYGLVERGQLRAIRLGTAIRVLESALDDWIRQQATGQASTSR